MAYPAGADLVNYLIQIGMLPDGTLPSQYHEDLIAHAIDSFESDTGWKPFLASSSVLELFTFTLKDSKRFIFPNGAVVVGSVKYLGEELVEGEDYVLEPLDTVPKRRLTFATPKMIIFNALEIEMLQGYTDELPSEVWFALIDKAVHRFIVDSQKDTGDVTSTRQGEVSFTYSGVGGGSIASARRLKNYQEVVAKYRRHLFG